MTTEEDVKRVTEQAEQRVREIAEDAREKLVEAGDRLDARLADFDTRATKEVGRWDGRQWGMAAAGFVLAVVLAFMAGRATAADPTDDIGVPGIECTLIDSDTGEIATADSMRVECREMADGTDDAPSDVG